MNTTTTASRIHPLMAGAAISVTVLCLVGAASIAGILPNSRANVPAIPADVAAMTPAGTNALAAAVAAPVVAQAAPAPAPAPVVRKRVVHHTQVAQARPAYNDNNDGYRETAYREPVRQPQPVPAPAPAQPNYVGIGTGAVIGGLIGNQVGGGRGKALATVAGVIGGGMLGNALQNQVQQPQR
ncbi:glycine zipper 2TM domain-containing protein [Janthinobacterium sp. LB3P112]|uniref:glycine zipper 2TM domain-containing protein n=1 Tax=Janthinobacterium sp. LB3P112 TaxID=3424196 RepID=UPI003F1EAAED